MSTFLSYTKSTLLSLFVMLFLLSLLGRPDIIDPLLSKIISWSDEEFMNFAALMNYFIILSILNILVLSNIKYDFDNKSLHQIDLFYYLYVFAGINYILGYLLYYKIVN